jgi:hypothetical protein
MQPLIFAAVAHAPPSACARSVLKAGRLWTQRHAAAPRHEPACIGSKTGHLPVYVFSSVVTNAQTSRNAVPMVHCHNHRLIGQTLSHSQKATRTGNDANVLCTPCTSKHTHMLGYAPGLIDFPAATVPVLVWSQQHPQRMIRQHHMPRQARATHLGQSPAAAHLAMAMPPRVPQSHCAPVLRRSQLPLLGYIALSG